MRKIGLAAGAALVLLSSAAMAQQAGREEKMIIARACAGDIERLCHGVPPGEGRIKACMKSHIRELSPGCFDALLHAIAAEKEPG